MVDGLLSLVVFWVLRSLGLVCRYVFCWLVCLPSVFVSECLGDLDVGRSSFGVREACGCCFQHDFPNLQFPAR